MTPVATPEPLPMPTRARWQPLRLGLVELFRYDSEEFWFRDGHLLLRGNNGTGKSKVLSLSLPFLFDAQLKPSRLEPDGDPGKRMAWNLLMGSYDRRIGYTWLEFGRVDETSGEPRFLTLGAGLSAVSARTAVESWYFLVEGGPGVPRVNDGLWLTSAQRVTLTKERLREAIGQQGQVFESAQSYRRAVDERLFGLGEARYEALMDTLIQLRQPQLSKKPDEAALSDALTEALPPLAPELLADVAEALARLEEDRHQLEDFRALAKSVERFEQRYRVYAGAQSRRQARGLRQAQTEFDNASRARNDAHVALAAARAAEAEATAALEAAELALDRRRARVQALIDDPANQDARRLDDAGREAMQRRDATRQAEAARDGARRRLETAVADADACAKRADAASVRLNEARDHWARLAAGAGVATAPSSEALLALDVATLADLPARDVERAGALLQASLAARRDQVRMLQRRQAELGQARTEHRRCEQLRDERKGVFDEASATREAADAAVEREGAALIDAWDRHADSLVRLRWPDGPRLDALSEWVRTLAGEDPLRRQLADARQVVRDASARERAAIGFRRDEIDAAIAVLRSEQQTLEAGVAPMPPVPYTRGPQTRGPQTPEAAGSATAASAGAPFWQLVDFREGLPPERKAGLEAALEASGLLDAWVFPDGRVDGVAGGMAALASWHDTRLEARAPFPTAGTLAAFLTPDPPRAPDDHPQVEAAYVQRLLEAVASGGEDCAEAEHWIGTDGRFRTGGLAGAWQKPAATYVGFAAREAARRQRLDALAQQMAGLSDEAVGLDRRSSALDEADRQADAEWQAAPDDRALRDSHAGAAVQAQAYRKARQRLAEADEALREAAEAMHTCHQRLLVDAADLRLPADPDALAAVEAVLTDCGQASQVLAGAVRDLRAAWPEWRRQQARELEARSDLAERDEALGSSRSLAEQAAERLQVLQQSVGLRVDELRSQLKAARDAQEAADRQLRQCRGEQSTAGQVRAVAQSTAGRAEQDLQQTVEHRGQQIERLRQFAASGLLASALPDIELPDDGMDWTIDPALTLARRIETRLQQVKDDDDAWHRVQRQINEELTELHRALGALGHHASGETTDWGLIVRIVYQNRPERPDRLGAILADEIAQRSELLTANEREILENHLQAEIAAEIQRLLQQAERQLAGINDELQRRPTSTGVRFRLLWEPLSAEEGAPVGLEVARRRLLNTSADLWSAEDRQRIGEMLQGRIVAERARDDEGGGLHEQLVRALDYRRWHRFRIERWQDGGWRKLSGPASSGERALGLTVPLFAAVASFYTRSPNPHAPRLILLDEAFAGIDDEARAHCMGLVSEFDLDFVITSEREWGCYAALPGVSICQLQRREGIDAVYVSRWSWDGRARRPEGDPDRRFPPGAA